MDLGCQECVANAFICWATLPSPALILSMFFSHLTFSHLKRMWQQVSATRCHTQRLPEHSRLVHTTSSTILFLCFLCFSQLKILVIIINQILPATLLWLSDPIASRAHTFILKIPAFTLRNVFSIYQEMKGKPVTEMGGSLPELWQSLWYLLHSCSRLDQSSKRPLGEKGEELRNRVFQYFCFCQKGGKMSAHWGLSRCQQTYLIPGVHHCPVT